MERGRRRGRRREGNRVIFSIKWKSLMYRVERLVEEEEKKKRKKRKRKECKKM